MLVETQVRAQAKGCVQHTACFRMFQSVQVLTHLSLCVQPHSLESTPAANQLLIMQLLLTKKVTSQANRKHQMWVA